MPKKGHTEEQIVPYYGRWKRVRGWPTVCRKGGNNQATSLGTEVTCSPLSEKKLGMI